MSIFDAYPKISEIEIFKRAEKENIEKYISVNSFWIKSFFPGETIASPDTPDTRFGILISGKALIYSIHNSKRVLLKTMLNKEMFGVANLYSENLPFPSYVMAKTAAKVLYISDEALKNLIENDRTVLHSYLAFMNTRILYLNRKIATLTAGTPEAKLTYLILENERDGTFIPATSVSGLAAMLDVGRASLYRAFDKLEAEKYIRREDKKIIILDKKRLMKDFFD